jgi:hypothetical protein
MLSRGEYKNSKGNSVSLGVVTTCGFVEGNGNLVAVLEDTLPPISDGFYQLKLSPPAKRLENSTCQAIHYLSF